MWSEVGSEVDEKRVILQLMKKVILEVDEKKVILGVDEKRVILKVDENRVILEEVVGD